MPGAGAASRFSTGWARAALDEFAGFVGAAGHPLRLLAARRRRSRGRRGAYARLHSEIRGPGPQPLGTPPREPEKDWIALVGRIG